MKTKLLFTTAIVFLSFAVFSVITGFQPKKPWVVPDKYAKMKNPVASNAESLKNGKELWIKIASHVMEKQDMVMDQRLHN